MKFTEENVPAHLKAFFDEIKPIAEKYNLLKKDSSLRIVTSTFNAISGASCGAQLGCHIQSVAEQTSPGHWEYQDECICPGDPRYVPSISDNE